MPILVLGAAGMLGHALVRELGQCHEVHAAVRGRIPGSLEGASKSYGGVDVTDVAAIDALLSAACPTSVINAAGVVKQRQESIATQIAVNALAPHRLVELCRGRRISFLHFSTDCVFSGARGCYSEEDEPDPIDLYGRSKLLGEVDDGALTLRTSMIGQEMHSDHGLVEWFLRQRGRVSGFRRAIFSGLTTLELARVVRLLYERGTSLSGLLHVSASPISKYDLLSQLAERLPWLPVRIEPVDEPVVDRSLSSTRFASLTGYAAPSWQDMLDELAGAIEERRGTKR